eukprot:scaffold39126_cov66-Phaeocystis_antarctica.AAC.6
MPRYHLLLLLLSQLASTSAHASCCTKHLTFIPDPEDVAPDQHEGQPRLIPDPADKRPPEWDDEDDGEWQPRDKANPAFTWRARLISNPKYSPPGFIEALLKEVLKAAPWVVLGLAVTVALEVAQLPLDGLGALLRSAGPFTGALAGLATPLCSCGMLPVAAGLVAKGVPLDVVVAFLTASQSAGLDSAAITWGLLGREAALCRLIGAVILATAAGLAVSSRRTAAPPTKHGRSTPDEAAARRGVLSRAWHAALDSASDVFPSVLLGLLLSTALTQGLPCLHTLTCQASHGVPQPCRTHPRRRAALPWGPTRGTYAVRVPALGVPFVPRAVAPQVAAHGLRLARADCGGDRRTRGVGRALGRARDTAARPRLRAAAPAVRALHRHLRGAHPARGRRTGPRLRLPALRAGHQPALAAAAAARGLAGGRAGPGPRLGGRRLRHRRATRRRGAHHHRARALEAEGGADMMELPGWHVLASPWVAAALAAAALARAVWRRARKSGEEVPDCCGEAEAPCTQEKQLRKSPRLKSS